MSLDTAPAGASSTSYVSVGEVGQNLFGPALRAWESLSSITEQEAVIRAAVEDIDCQLLTGVRFSSEQALRFPFSDHYTITDSVKVPYIHPRVKRACYLQIADKLLSSGMSDALQYRDKGITSLSMPGGVKASFANKPVTTKALLCVKARSLLAPFFVPGIIAVRR